MSACLTIPSAAEENLGVLLGCVRARLAAVLEAELARRGFDLNQTQYVVLKRLALCGPQSPGELAQAVGHDAGAMTRVIDRLEAKGYLRREPHPSDRRALRIVPTEAGAALWAQLRDCGERVLEQALSRLPAADRIQLAVSLKSILEALNDAHTPASPPA